MPINCSNNSGIHPWNQTCSWISDSDLRTATCDYHLAILVGPWALAEVFPLVVARHLWLVGQFKRFLVQVQLDLTILSWRFSSFEVEVRRLLNSPTCSQRPSSKLELAIGMSLISSKFWSFSASWASGSFWYLSIVSWCSISMKMLIWLFLREIGNATFVARQ